MNEISTFKRCIMWFCAASFYCFQFILRVSPSVIANDLMSTLMIDACMLGTIVSFFYTGYTLMQVPTGLILDRLGVGRPLSIACLLCSLGSIIFTYGDSITALSLGRAMTGVGAAFGFLSCIKVASQNFKPQRMALFVSLTMVLGTIGGTCGGAPFAKLVSMIGWRESYKILAIAGLVLSVFIFAMFRNSHSHDHAATAAAARSENIFLGVMVILRNPQTWIYGLYGFMMYVPLSGFADLWAAPYIAQVFKVDRTTAGGVVSMTYIGLAIGAPLWSSYVARIKSYKKGMLYSAIATGICFTLVIYLPRLLFLNHIALELTYVLMALGGASSAGQFIAFAGVSELNPSHRTATASGVHNMLCMFSGIIMMPLIGKLLDIVDGGTGSTLFSTEGFQIALAIVPFSIVFAVIVMAFVKESYPGTVKRQDPVSMKPLHAKA